jgi:plasmid stabilization system protein ParE
MRETEISVIAGGRIRPPTPILASLLYLIVYDPVRHPVEIVAVLHGARVLKRLLSKRS